MAMVGEPLLQSLLGAIGLGVTVFILHMKTVPAMEQDAKANKDC